MSRRLPDRGAFRLARAGLLGCTSLLLATGAHLVGGGTLPGPWVMIAAAAVLGSLAVTATVRRCRFGLLLILLGGEQLALHAFFAAASGGAAVSWFGVGGSVHAGHQPLHLMPGAAAMTGGAPSDAMLLAHACATVLTAWLLARGEAWWWRLTERALAWAGARPTRRRARAFVVRAPVAADRFVVLTLNADAPRRGPPVVV